MKRYCGGRQCTCLALLWKHRQEDMNMNSVWECSRNDIASNIAAILAAGAVWVTAAAWPDLLIGVDPRRPLSALRKPAALQPH